LEFKRKEIGNPKSLLDQADGGETLLSVNDVGSIRLLHKDKSLQKIERRLVRRLEGVDVLEQLLHLGSFPTVTALIIRNLETGWLIESS
jgi:hypothetical protein